MDGSLGDELIELLRSYSKPSQQPTAVSRSQAAALVSSFTRHPAPPPHEQWMHAGKKAGKKPARLSVGALADADIQAMSGDQLFDLFAELSQHDTLDEHLMRRLVDDMDRRERATPLPALDDDAMTPQQRRVDQLVASGRDFLSAYAEVHGDDERRLAEEARASGVDRKSGEDVRVAVRRSYDEWLHVAYLQAEKATRGNMLNRAGKTARIDPLELFTGPVSRARRYASEELMRWWARNERLNFTQFRAQVLGRAGDVAAAEKTRLLSNAKDFI